MRYMTAARCVCEFRIRLARCVSELMPNWLRARRRGDCVSELMPNWLRARRHGAWSLVLVPAVPCTCPTLALPAPQRTRLARDRLSASDRSPKALWRVARAARAVCGAMGRAFMGISNAFRVVCDCVHGHVCLS